MHVEVPSVHIMIFSLEIICDCVRPRIQDTEACLIYQALWEKHKKTHSYDHLMGVRRMLQRPQQLQPWQI